MVLCGIKEKAGQPEKVGNMEVKKIR